MKFYFCETCGKRLTENDLAEGAGKNKKLKGVFCKECAVGVTTMDDMPLTEEKARQLLLTGKESSGPTNVPKPDAMKFYFCEKCGTRLDERDIEAGKARDKKLKGVYCRGCAEGVMTMEYEGMTSEEARRLVAESEQSKRRPSGEVDVMAAAKRRRDSSRRIDPARARRPKSGIRTAVDAPAGRTRTQPAASKGGLGIAVAIGGGVLLLLVVVFVLFKSPSRSAVAKKRSRKPASKTEPTKTESTKPAPTANNSGKATEDTSQTSTPSEASSTEVASLPEKKAESDQGAASSATNPDAKVPTTVKTPVKVEPDPPPEAFESQSGLLAYWPLDGNGTDVCGELHGKVAKKQWVKGRFGQCIQKNGKGPSMRITKTAKLAVPRLTASIWFRPSGKNGVGGALVSKGSERREGSWALRLSGGGPVAMVVQGGIRNFPGTTTLAPGEWHHVAMTLGDRSVRLYLDGKLEAQGELSSPYVPVAEDLALGSQAFQERFWHPYYGELDDFRIYDRVLKGWEIKGLYQLDVQAFERPEKQPESAVSAPLAIKPPPPDPKWPPIMTAEQRKTKSMLDAVAALLEEDKHDAAKQRAAKEAVPLSGAVQATLKLGADLYEQTREALEKGLSKPVEVNLPRLKLTGKLKRIQRGRAWIQARGMEMPVKAENLPREVYVSVLKQIRTGAEAMEGEAALRMYLGDMEGSRELVGENVGNEAPAALRLASAYKRLDRLARFEQAVKKLEDDAYRLDAQATRKQVTSIRNGFPKLSASTHKARIEHLLKVGEGRSPSVFLKRMFKGELLELRDDYYVAVRYTPKAGVAVWDDFILSKGWKKGQGGMGGKSGWPLTTPGALHRIRFEPAELSVEWVIKGSFDVSLASTGYSQVKARWYGGGQLHMIYAQSYRGGSATGSPWPVPGRTGPYRLQITRSRQKVDFAIDGKPIRSVPLPAARVEKEPPARVSFASLKGMWVSEVVIKGRVSKAWLMEQLQKQKP